VIKTVMARGEHDMPVHDLLTIAALARQGEGHFVLRNRYGDVWMAVCVGCAVGYPWAYIVRGGWLHACWRTGALSHRCGRCGMPGEQCDG
jgi:hypothetical protein